MKNFKRINVLDLEATCWESGNHQPYGQKSEIIEIGLTELDYVTLEIGRTVSYPITPKRSTVSKFCTELTGWTDAKLERQGVPLWIRYETLLEKHGFQNRLMVVDSEYDIDFFQSQPGQTPFHRDTFPKDIMNVTSLFNALTGCTRNLSLEEKLNHVGLFYEGTAHRAGDDSRNIARLYREILLKSRKQFNPLGPRWSTLA